MRVIIDAQKVEEKRQRKIKILSMILLGIMVLSSVGYAFLAAIPSGEENTPNQENPLRLVGDRWILSLEGGQSLSFTHGLNETSDISVNINKTLNDYYGAILLISSNDSRVNTELETTLGRYANRIQEVCYGTCEKDLPEKNCSESLIVFKTSDINRVYQEEQCVILEGDMRSVDAFIYRMIGLSK